MKAYQGDLSGGAPVCHQSIREGEHKKLGAFDPLQSFTLLGINIIPLISLFLLLQFLHFLVHMAIFLHKLQNTLGKNMKIYLVWAQDTLRPTGDRRNGVGKMANPEINHWERWRKSQTGKKMTSGYN